MLFSYKKSYFKILCIILTGTQNTLYVVNYTIPIIDSKLFVLYSPFDPVNSI